MTDEKKEVGETKQQESAYFDVQHISVMQLDALLFATETEGHKLVWLRAERVGATCSYEYTAMFERKQNSESESPFTTESSW